MFVRLGDSVARYWLAVVLCWIGLVVAVRVVAPRWDDVTNDGDLAYLPQDMPSIVGQRLTQDAFPANRSKSQIVLILAREGSRLKPADRLVADQIAQRFHNLHGASSLERGRSLMREAEILRRKGNDVDAEQREVDAEEALQAALVALDEAIDLDEGFAYARHNRALVRAAWGQLELADRDREIAWRLRPELRSLKEVPWPAYAGELPFVDVWTHRSVFKSKLLSEDKQAQLIIVQLSDEFMSTGNIRVMNRVEQEMEEVRAWHEKLRRSEYLRTRDALSQAEQSEDAQRVEEARKAYEKARNDLHDATELTLGISGSAAVGGDMLRSAAESIRNTEMFTITLVVLILLIVYRAPLLITIPLVTIGVSLSVSIGLLSLLTQLNSLPGMAWWDFKVFKTTKIFIVVILFGAGTDFCLFLIARYRELLGEGLAAPVALSRALAGVGNALAGSALTTILGLGMMFFADFGKFHYSGPAIGLCLAVGLLACLTLAPALLRALGQAVFWPFHRDLSVPDRSANGAARSRVPARNRMPSPARFWHRLARLIVLYPGRVLVVCFLLLAPLGVVGYFTDGNVTFDLVSELSAKRPSLQGSQLLKRHFPIGEGGPVIVLAVKEDAGFGDESKEKLARVYAGIYDLTHSLLEIEGVRAVRSLAEPLGDRPQRMSIVSAAGRMKLVVREHHITKSIFIAQAPGYRGNVTRLELILDEDPFSKAAIRTLTRVDASLQREAQDKDSFWSGAKFFYTGTTAGIRDLRTVTRSDQSRIQWLVVVAVFTVLLVILRRPLVCLYLVLSVLFSYYVTIGATELFFSWAYGDSFQGLDWKVPVFLFVILVAVGEDYNIYLVTRVFQEQKRRGPFAGLREAIVRTGGIITSCGIIMAGTFVSMTSGTLRGIVELGFALSLGVLLDTLVVRTMLVPAFLALLCRWQAGRKH
ncbi:MAG: MMPL family transporter [Pirellulaceae bacterium]